MKIKWKEFISIWWSIFWRSIVYGIIWTLIVKFIIDPTIIDAIRRHYMFIDIVVTYFIWFLGGFLAVSLACKHTVEKRLSKNSSGLKNQLKRILEEIT